MTRAQLVAEHRVAFFGHTNLHALQSIARGVAVHRLDTTVLSTLRLLRDIAIPHNLAVHVLDWSYDTHQHRIFRHLGSNGNDTFRIQLVVVQSLLALHRFLVQRIHSRIGELGVDLRRRVCHVLHEIVGVVVDGLEHTALHRGRINHHRVLLVEARIRRDGHEGVLTVRHASTCAHDFAVHPCLRQRNLRQDRHDRNRIKSLEVIGVEPRTGLLGLRNGKGVARPRVVVREGNESSQCRQSKERMNL